MALSLGVHIGDKILIGEHCLEVKAIARSSDPSAGDLITVALDGGEDVQITDQSKTKLAPEVWVFSGIGATGNRSRLAFEAPPAILIRRLSI